MNKKLFEALISVSSTSSSAKQLAQSIVAESSPDLVKSLYDKIALLERQIAELTMLTDIDDELSDEEVRDITDNMNKRLKDVDENQLHRLGLDYLRIFPKHVRPIIATALKNKAVALKTHVLPEWSDVIALGGEIK